MAFLRLRFWGKDDQKRYPTLVLSPRGIRKEKLPIPLGEPWLWGRDFWYVVVEREVECEGKRQSEYIPFELPKPDKDKNKNFLTPADLMLLINQDAVRELIHPPSGLLQKIEVGLLVALTLGLGFLLFVMYSSLTGG